MNNDPIPADLPDDTVTSVTAVEPEVAGRSVGVFGGTFDPPHLGHLALAVEVRHALRLDLVAMMVASQPWQKTGTRAITDAALRLEMTRRLAAGADGVVASSLEVARGGATYTVDTLRELAGAGAARLVVVLGADAAANFSTWSDPGAIAALASFAVVTRPGEPALDDIEVWPGAEVTRVDVPPLDISSTWLRDRAAAGHPVVPWTTPEVAGVIERERLYRRPGT